MATKIAGVPHFVVVTTSVATLPAERQWRKASPESTDRLKPAVVQF